METHMSIRKAARAVGISHPTLKRWLAKDLGIVFPAVPRGSCILVRVRDVETVIARRRDARNVHLRYPDRAK